MRCCCRAATGDILVTPAVGPRCWRWLAAALLVIVLLPAIKKSREEAFVEDDARPPAG